jgi:hypothetical protein
MPFDPNQPRDPKGTSTGGQWTAGYGPAESRFASEMLLGQQWRASSAADPAEATRAAENPAEAFVRPDGISDHNARAEAKARIVKGIRDALVNSKLTDQQLMEFSREFRGEAYELSSDTRTTLATIGAQGLVDAWAESSADSVPRAIAVQLAANDLMGSPPMHVPPSWGERNASTRRLGAELAETHRAALDVALGHIYQDTQAKLKAAGIETVEVYRGMLVNRGDFRVGDAKIPLDRAHVGEVTLQPLSSFSSNVETASSFSLEGLPSTVRATETSPVAVMMAVRVPRAQVFSTAQTGMGCLSESEFILSGGTPTRAVYAGTQNASAGYSWFPELVAEAPRKL